MAVHQSVIKRARQNEKARQRNRSWKSRIRTQQKRLEDALAGEKKEKAVELLYKEYCAIIDKAASRRVIHRNTASRRKIRMHDLIQSWETGKRGPSSHADKKKPQAASRKTTQKTKTSKDVKVDQQEMPAEEDRTPLKEKAASKPKAPPKTKTATKKASSKSKETSTEDASS
ncbi:MAG: 30S ribosomal protein S20 [Spirochaetes bacterium]|nr:30S ribosomal protein S20 [Spirochaetota bacterium]